MKTAIAIGEGLVFVVFMGFMYFVINAGCIVWHGAHACR